MFGISMWELVLIGVVALILLGPRQLAETARVVGRLYRELLKLTSEVKETINLDNLADLGEPKYNSPPKTDLPRRPTTPQEIISAPGEKTGPDFYAELLEQSAEKTDPETSEDAEKKGAKQDYTVKEQNVLLGKTTDERGPIH